MPLLNYNALTAFARLRRQIERSWEEERETGIRGRHGRRERREGDGRRDVVPTGSTLAHETDLALKRLVAGGQAGQCVCVHLCVQASRGEEERAESRQRHQDGETRRRKEVETGGWRDGKGRDEARRWEIEQDSVAEWEERGRDAIWHLFRRGRLRWLIEEGVT